MWTGKQVALASLGVVVGAFALYVLLIMLTGLKLIIFGF